LYGFNFGVIGVFIFSWIGLFQKTSLKVGISALRDLASNDFREQKGTFIKQTPVPKPLYITGFKNKPLFYSLEFNHGKYFYLRTPLYFEMEQGKKYLLTFYERSRILVDVKEIDGTEVHNSEAFESI